MAGVVHVPWYATVFRGDKLEAALKEIAPIALRYGASSYAVHRNRDDPYKLLQMATFESKSDWERYWNGPDMIRFRAVNQSLYQVPLLYSWADVVVEGYLDEERQREDLRGDREVSGTAEMN
jgi:hypothetical protein